ncbi:Arginine decarboxylase [Forsythia ovata]|uniref:Arginine decarboxylase n=1 Tax=Forsythia ovata TaxID=205694 RepID=A0ABD1SRF3_9LAMI
MLFLLDMSLSLSFGNYWSFKLNKGPRACISQEKCRLGLGKRQEAKRQSEILEYDTALDATGIDNKKVKDSRHPPLVSALKASAEENAASFHFPGHNRGQAAPSSLRQLIGVRAFLHDLPELPELDNLFAPEGPILEAQKQAAELFGASETWFLVGGSTCGVQAAIMATCLPGDTLILPRNSHISAISAMILSGVLPKYIVPEYDHNWDIAGGFTPSQVEKAIEELEMEGRKPAAVLVISPTYHGVCSNIGAIAELCHTHKIPIIVDEAHGAHFGFHLQLPISALAQGADLVIQSTHKVLCSLTQSSMLHMSGNLVDRERICKCLQTLQSSSPSYLLLASLDAARAHLSDNQGTVFNKAVELTLEAKNMINRIRGISLLDLTNSNFSAIDPLRVTIGVWRLGLSGFEADDILCRDFKVVSELVGTRSMTFAFNLGTKREHVLRLVSGLKYLSATFSATDDTENRAVDVLCLTPFNDISMSLSPREAFFSKKRKISIKDSLGKICGELICPYPPGIPVLIPGEIITERALNYLLHVKSKGAIISGAADHLLSSLLICHD